MTRSGILRVLVDEYAANEARDLSYAALNSELENEDPSQVERAVLDFIQRLIIDDVVRPHEVMLLAARGSDPGIARGSARNCGKGKYSQRNHQASPSRGGLDTKTKKQGHFRGTCFSRIVYMPGRS